MQYAILQSNSPRLVGRVPVCACFSATCVYSECQKMLLSLSLVSPWPLTCVSLASHLCFLAPLLVPFTLNFGAFFADFHGLTSI